MAPEDEDIPPWAAAVLPPAPDDGPQLVIRSNLSPRTFASQYGLDPVYFRKCVDAGLILFAPAPYEMRLRQLARHSGYSPEVIRRMVRAKVLHPVRRWKNGEMIFMSDALPIREGADRWVDPFQLTPWEFAKRYNALRRIRAAGRDVERTDPTDWNARAKTFREELKAQKAEERAQRRSEGTAEPPVTDGRRRPRRP